MWTTDTTSVLADSGNVTADGYALIAAPLVPVDKKRAAARRRLIIAGSGKNFSRKDPEGVEYFGIDFAPGLDTAETIQSATFRCVVIEGADPGAAAMLLGAAVIDGSVVWQKIGAGVSRVRYLVGASIQTSAGQVQVEAGTLEVVEIG